MTISPPQPTLDYCKSIRTQYHAEINAENQRLLLERDYIVSQVVKKIFDNFCLQIDFSNPEKEQGIHEHFWFIELNSSKKHGSHKGISKAFSDIIAEDSVYHVYKGETGLRDNVETELRMISQLVIQRLNELMRELAKECSVIGLELTSDLRGDIWGIECKVRLLKKLPKSQAKGFLC